MQCYQSSRAMNSFLVVTGCVPAAVQLAVNTYRYTRNDCPIDTPDAPLVIVSNLISICTALSVSAYLFYLVMTRRKEPPCYVSPIPDRVKWLVVALCGFWSASIAIVSACMWLSSAAQWCADTLPSGFVPFAQAFANPVNMLTFFSVMLYEDTFPGHDATRCRTVKQQPPTKKEEEDVVEIDD